eukprot:TRINITY_DN3764_c0_g1_i2.p1 TRINITY_DN3764_c0_g1~~TRINITY_DN3764_c0_g1_i2.p1  ORF type:complete len:199 (-),score=54.31 TRINITY_DN3764_c0_g1_i2:102-698(-)
MAPVIGHEIVVDDEPMSRTHQYRKIVKPLLERKRRARINACLDELKDIMVFALQTEGESISKLEKADVLELTVKHLRKLKRQQMLALNPALDMDRFHAGYTTCATEVSRTLASTGVDISIGSRLMSHLGHKLNTIGSLNISPLTVRVPEPRAPKFMRMPSPSSDAGYDSGRDSTPSPRNTTSPISSSHQQNEAVWRPF